MVMSGVESRPSAKAAWARTSLQPPLGNSKEVHQRASGATRVLKPLSITSGRASRSAIEAIVNPTNGELVAFARVPGRPSA